MKTFLFGLVFGLFVSLRTVFLGTADAIGTAGEFLLRSIRDFPLGKVLSSLAPSSSPMLLDTGSMVDHAGTGPRHPVYDLSHRTNGHSLTGAAGGNGLPSPRLA